MADGSLVLGGGIIATSLIALFILLRRFKRLRNRRMEIEKEITEIEHEIANPSVKENDDD